MVSILFSFTHILSIAADNAKKIIGYAQEDDPNSTFEEHLNDSKRIKYMMDHIEAMVAAIR